LIIKNISILVLEVFLG